MKLLILLFSLSVFAQENDTIINGKVYQRGNIETLYKGEYKQVTKIFYTYEGDEIRQICLYRREDHIQETDV